MKNGKRDLSVFYFPFPEIFDIWNNNVLCIVVLVL